MQKGLEVMSQNPQEMTNQLRQYVNFVTQDNGSMRRLYIDRIANQLIQKSLEVFEGANLNKLLQVLSQYVTPAADLDPARQR